MALRLGRTARVIGWIVAALLLAAIAFAVGTGVPRFGVDLASVESSQPGVPEAGAPQRSHGSAAVMEGYSTFSKDAAASEEAAQGGGTVEPMVVRTATLDMQVDELQPALAGVRSAARKYDATVEQLAVSGGDGGPKPLPSAEAAYPTPANGTVVLRVPATKLEALTREISELGVVISQSSSADDVTQQYVDMAARLKNLKAEEARLRSFFSRAVKVSDLLAIESELARVRGEIESMQAQVDYLERQVARATLTVTMTEPGPVIQPSGADWGFAEAVRRGIQGAAALVTTLITVVIALAPVLALALLAWLAIRWAVRRRRARRALNDEPVDADTTQESDA